MGGNSEQAYTRPGGLLLNYVGAVTRLSIVGHQKPETIIFLIRRAAG